MIKMAGRRANGRDVLVIGLSHRNLDLLRDQKPMQINGKELGVDCDVMIFAGATEEMVWNEFKARGFVDGEFGELPPGEVIFNPNETEHPNADDNDR